MKRQLALVLLLCLSSTSFAIDIDWTNANLNNQWEDGLNWAGGVKPGAADTARIGKTGTDRAIISQPGELADFVRVGHGGMAGELQMTAGDLTVINSIILGNGVAGTLDQDNGNIVILENLRIGVGGGTGTWDISGGTLFAKRIIVGTTNASTTGTVNQTGGIVTSDEHYMIGDNGNGILTITGGEIHAGTSDQRAFIAGLSGATGSSTTTIGGTGKVFANDTNIGDNARGSNILVVEGTGQLNAGRVGAAMRIAANNNVTGHVTVREFGEINVGSNPLAGVRGPIVVGVNGSATSVNDATLTVQDSGIVRASFLLMADSANAKGKVKLEGGSIDLTGPFFVGSPGKTGTMAELEMTGGLLKAQHFLVTDGATQTAVANISGGAVQLTGLTLVGADSNLGSALLTFDAVGTVLTGSGIIVRNNGDVVHRMGDIVLTGGLTITAEASPGFGRGTYDLQMGSILMGGDRRPTIEQYILDGVLFSSDPLFKSFMVSYDAAANTTLLTVMKIPEPTSFLLLAVALSAIWLRGSRQCRDG